MVGFRRFLGIFGGELASFGGIFLTLAASFATSDRLFRWAAWCFGAMLALRLIAVPGYYFRRSLRTASVIVRDVLLLTAAAGAVVAAVLSVPALLVASDWTASLIVVATEFQAFARSRRLARAGQPSGLLSVAQSKVREQWIRNLAAGRFDEAFSYCLEDETVLLDGSEGRWAQRMSNPSAYSSVGYAPPGLPPWPAAFGVFDALVRLTRASVEWRRRPVSTADPHLAASVLAGLGKAGAALADMAKRLRTAALMEANPQAPNMAASLAHVCTAAGSIGKAADAASEFGRDANDRSASAILGGADLSQIAIEVASLVAALEEVWHISDQTDLR